MKRTLASILVSLSLACGSDSPSSLSIPPRTPMNEQQEPSHEQPAFTIVPTAPAVLFPYADFHQQETQQRECEKDDNFRRIPNACGDGNRGTAWYTCNNFQYVFERCEEPPQPLPSCTPEPERCDQLDNDCDGITDNLEERLSCPSPSVGHIIQTCAERIEHCTLPSEPSQLCREIRNISSSIPGRQQQTYDSYADTDGTALIFVAGHASDWSDIYYLRELSGVVERITHHFRGWRSYSFPTLFGSYRAAEGCGNSIPTGCVPVGISWYHEDGRQSTISMFPAYDQLADPTLFGDGLLTFITIKQMESLHAVFLYNLHTDVSTPIAQGAYYFPPQGYDKHIVFSNARSNERPAHIFWYDVQTSRTEEIATELREADRILDGKRSLYGSQVAFTVFSPRTARTSDIYLFDKVASSIRNITQSPEAERRPSLRENILAYEEGPLFNARIAVMNLHSGQKGYIPISPAMTPVVGEGFVAFVKQADDSHDIHICRLEEQFLEGE